MSFFVMCLSARAWRATALPKPSVYSATLAEVSRSSVFNEHSLRRGTFARLRSHCLSR